MLNQSVSQAVKTSLFISIDYLPRAVPTTARATRAPRPASSSIDFFSFPRSLKAAFTSGSFALPYTWRCVLVQRETRTLLVGTVPLVLSYKIIKNFGMLIISKTV